MPPPPAACRALPAWLSFDAATGVFSGTPVNADVGILNVSVTATDLAGASVITLYLLPEFNLRLRPRLLALPAGTRIVSHDWDMGDWPPDRTLTLAVPEKAIGLDKRSRLLLWVVPAQVAVHPIQQILRFRYYQVLTVQTEAPHPLLVTQDMYQV